ncbi:MAG: hypothetical protein Kow0069_38830 [Promethearchaeota archaeon]
MRTAVLDTTYVLPLFGFEVSGGDHEEEKIARLWEGGVENYRIYLPSACLVEVLYRFNAVLRRGYSADTAARYSQVLPTIITSKAVEVHNSFTDPKVAEVAFRIRALGHGDIFDCLIAGTALAVGGVFVTRDSALKNVLTNVAPPDLAVDLVGLDDLLSGHGDAD